LHCAVAFCETFGKLLEGSTFLIGGEQLVIAGSLRIFLGWIAPKYYEYGLHPPWLLELGGNWFAGRICFPLKGDSLLVVKSFTGLS
jgi:hypothetical protein